jgi:hypothetical protein
VSRVVVLRAAHRIAATTCLVLSRCSLPRVPRCCTAYYHVSRAVAVLTTTCPVLLFCSRFQTTCCPTHLAHELATTRISWADGGRTALHLAVANAPAVSGAPVLKRLVQALRSSVNTSDSKSPDIASAPHSAVSGGTQGDGGSVSHQTHQAHDAGDSSWRDALTSIDDSGDGLLHAALKRCDEDVRYTQFVPSLLCEVVRISKPIGQSL